VSGRGVGLLVAGCTSIAADPRTFHGTEWQVDAIDRQATPRAENPRGARRIMSIFRPPISGRQSRRLTLISPSSRNSRRPSRARRRRCLGPWKLLAAG